MIFLRIDCPMLFFNALHGMQTRSSDENSVCLSVRLSVCLSVERLICDETKVVPPFLYHMKNHLPSFVTRRMVGGGDPFCLKFLINRPRWSEIADCEPIYSRSASAIAPSEINSININRKSTTRFPMSPR